MTTSNEPPSGSTPASEGKKRKKWPWIVGGVLVVGLIGSQLTDDADDTENTATEGTTEQTTAEGTTVEEPAAEGVVPPVEETPLEEEAPLEETTEEAPARLEENIIGNPLFFVEDNRDIPIQAVDFWPEISDFADRQRGIFDKANWRVVAYCEEPNSRGNFVVGAVQLDEWDQMQATGLADELRGNSMRYYLDCSLGG